MKQRIHESIGQNGSLDWKRLLDVPEIPNWRRWERAILATKILLAVAGLAALFLLGYLMGVEAGR